MCVCVCVFGCGCLCVCPCLHLCVFCILQLACEKVLEVVGGLVPQAPSPSKPSEEVTPTRPKFRKGALLHLLGHDLGVGLEV